MRTKIVAALVVACAGAATGLTPAAQATTTDAAASVTSSILIETPPSVLAPLPAPQAVPLPAETAPPAIAAPAPVPVDPIVAAARELVAKLGTRDAVKDDRAALAAFYGRDGAAPMWVTASGAFNARAKLAAAEIARADDWGLRASDYDLPDTGATISTPEGRADAEVALSLAAMKYIRHARGGRFDPKELSFYIDRTPPVRDPNVVLTELAGSGEPDALLRKQHPKHVQFERLRQAYLAARAGRPPVDVAAAEPDDETPRKGSKKQAAAREPVNYERKLLANMEQWRWMPESLGATYVWSNIPEYQVRVMRDGAAIHQERIIVGKTINQTPVFSDEMETIVLHPFWGVPDSIKIKELWPGLVRGQDTLARNGLRVQRGGRDIDPSSVDWSQINMKHVHVYQPPGSANVLGQLKFLFPNEHQVYMHDTPTKNLFNASQRTFSHGCMRVRNPVRLAEVILQHDKGWEPRRLHAMIDNGPQNNTITLTTKIPVHVTYFTAMVDETGKATFYPDVYGHEPKIHMGIDGKAHLIVKKKENLDQFRAEAVTRLVEAKPAPSSAKTPDWARKLFGFN